MRGAAVRQAACNGQRMFYDLRYALRTLRKSPGFALVAIISLALGIGANSAMFSLADAVLLRPLPVPHASEFIVVQSHLRGESVGGLAQYSGLSYPDFKDLRDRNKSYTGLAASQYSQFGFATEKGALPQMKYGELVSGDFFRVLDVPLELGRPFRPDEDKVPGRDAVVVLGHELWRTDFASDRSVVGRTIFLNNVPFTVIGVALEPFTGSNGLIRSALFVPIAMGPRLQDDLQQSMLEKRDNRGMIVHGRLKPGVSLAQAAAEARVVSQQLAQAYPATNRTSSMVVDSDLRARLKKGPEVRRDVVFPAGYGRRGFVDRLCERGEYPVEPRPGPVTGDRRPAGYRGGPRPPGQATVDREPDDRGARRGAGAAGGRGRRGSVWPDQDIHRHARGAGREAGPAGAAVHHAGLGGERPFVWTGSGVAEQPSRLGSGAKVRKVG